VYKENLTYSEAIEKVMIENGGFATLKYIDANLEKYRERTGKTPYDTIVGEVQMRDMFARISKGVWGLAEFLKDVEEYDLGFFTIQKDNIVFKKKKEIQITEKIVKQKVRIGQNSFRNDLLKILKICPITKIDDKKY
jgi:hypothetical protein